MSKTNNQEDQTAIEPTVESGIPIPPDYRGGKTEIMRKMKVGDSIVVPRNEAHNWYFIARGIGYRACFRTISETEARVWRIA